MTMQSFVSLSDQIIEERCVTLKDTFSDADSCFALQTIVTSLIEGATRPF